MNPLPAPALTLALAAFANLASSGAPYPRSEIIEQVQWHWNTLKSAAPGSDLWPVTSSNDSLWAAWGDGGGFGGTDSQGRVAMGIARIDGSPENFVGINVNGGYSPRHPASFPAKGKTVGIAAIDGVLYLTVNLQDGKWPDVNHALFWSEDSAATWKRVDWIFPKGAGNFQPARFLNFGPDYTGVPDRLAGYAYIYGPKQSKPGSHSGHELFLARVSLTRLRTQSAWQYFAGTDTSHQLGATPRWSERWSDAQPIFSDTNGTVCAGAVYNPALKRFLLTTFHTGPGQLGVFEATEPWGQWKTVAYEQNWGGMGTEGEGLSCEFPQKWMSADGLDLWCVLSVYGPGAKQGIEAHDRFNLVKVTLKN